MTAIIVELRVLSEAEAIAGPEFSVPLGRVGVATHAGCNWVGCPAEIVMALESLDGVSVGTDFWGLCEALEIARIEANAT